MVIPQIFILTLFVTLGPSFNFEYKTPVHAFRSEKKCNEAKNWQEYRFLKNDYSRLECVALFVVD